MNQLRESLSEFDKALFEIAGTRITVMTVFVFVAILLLAFIVAWLAQRATGRMLRAAGLKDEGTLWVVQRLTHYVLIAVGIAIGLQTIGVNLSAVFAAGALFAVGVGFALQNLTQNFVSGLILLAERSIKPGDVLSVDDRLVKVSRLGMRTTHARTLDDEEIIVPNALIAQSTVVNYTLRDSFYRLRCTVGVVYSSDMAVVRRTLEQVGTAATWRAMTKDPVVLLTDFGSSSVDWELSVWINDPWNMRRRRSDLNEAIWNALKSVDVVIAFPQVDVHLDPPVMESLQKLRRAG